MDQNTNEVASTETSVAPVTNDAATVAASEPVATVTPEVPVSEPVAAVTPEPVAVAAPSKPKPKSKGKSKKAVKAKAKPKSKPAKVEVSRGRGRPVVFKGVQKRHIVSVIRKHGLTKGREVLAGEKISISLPTLGKFAAEAGIELHRGRPAA